MSPDMEPPDWLPDGWIMEVRKGKNGSTYRYYTCPISGYTFCSKREVLHYLNIIKDDDGDDPAFQINACFKDNNRQLIEPAIDSITWLPSGWILEVRVETSGTKEEQIYKCYIDPATGSRFFSKEEVLSYLKEGKFSSPKSSHGSNYDEDPTNNVLARIEYSPDGLPHGWVKMFKFRRNVYKGGIRKDPYYIDPAGEFVFRTLKDVTIFLESGEISKHATKLTKGFLGIYSLKMDSSPPIAAKMLKSPVTEMRQHLLGGQAANSNGPLVIKTEELHKNPPMSTLDLTSSQCEEGPLPVCSAPDIKPEEGKPKKKLRKSEPSTCGDVKTRKAKKRTTEMLDPAIMESPELSKYFRTKATDRQNCSKQEKKSKKPTEEPRNIPLDLPIKLEHEGETDLHDQKNGKPSIPEGELLEVKNVKDSLDENPFEQEGEPDLHDHENWKSSIPESEILEVENVKDSSDENPIEQEGEPDLHDQENGKPSITEGELLEVKNVMDSSDENPIVGLKKSDNKCKAQSMNSLSRRGSKRLAGVGAPPRDDSLRGSNFHAVMMSKGRIK
ncbi:uncharacterized protein [Typha latifolia]|uniref:uncharacterized protein isoform X1 n=1 Tax=Typha latifolia TaxID=4733 RepID=UPI003C30601C